MNFNGTLGRQDNSQGDSEILHGETVGSKNMFHLLMQWNILQYHTGGDCRALCVGTRGSAWQSTHGPRTGIIWDGNCRNVLNTGNRPVVALWSCPRGLKSYLPSLPWRQNLVCREVSSQFFTWVNYSPQST